MKYKLILLLAATFAVPATCDASIKFTYLEVGGNVVMTSSGTLETANLIAGGPDTWAGTGFGNYGNGGGIVAMMGSHPSGDLDSSFRFSAGTDLSAWAGGTPWTSENLGFSRDSGSKDFATYAEDANGFWVPGILLQSGDLVGTTWTPDNTWSIAGTFASLNMNPGTYTVSDARTGESITYQIGPLNSAVPEPASFVIFGSLLALGTVVARRKFVR